MGVDDADIRLYDIWWRPACRPDYLDYLKRRFFSAQNNKTQHGGDFKGGQQSVPGFFVDLFYGPV